MTETPYSVSDPPATPTDVEPLLSSGLAARDSSPAALERIRAVVAQAWVANSSQSQVVSHRSRGRLALWRGLAIAASVLALAVTLFAVRPAADRQMIGSLARSVEGGTDTSQGYFSRRSVAAGDVLRVGDTLNVRGSLLVTLTQGGTLRLAKGTVITVSTDSQITLEHGLIYLDKPPGNSDVRPLRVGTRAGLIEHVGTEFEVMSDEHVVRIRVREGQIRYSGVTGPVLAGAGTEVVASAGGMVTQRSVLSYGSDWQWIATLAPSFAVEGRPLMDYLQWVSRELGRPLIFADEQARESAHRTILHGFAQDQATLDALADVLSTTNLSFELAEGAIRIHSNR
jgi:ferric-dicitrate binding protein FerR (iron transport regulator)